MDRAEAGGFGIAAAGHVALFAALTLGFASTQLPVSKNDPIEIAFVDEVGLESEAPVVSAEMPAPALGQPEAPLTAAPVSEPLPSLPQPQPTPPAPQPQPKAKAQPQPKSAPPKAKAAQPKAKAQPKQASGGRLDGILAGINPSASQGKATTPPAAKAGPQVQASLVAEVRRQVRPHWQRAAPTGADVEKLRTEVTISLSRSGAVTDVDIGQTTGQTSSNRPQVALHRERAARAVRLAGPYDLPDQYYDAWKRITITLDLRLAQ